MNIPVSKPFAVKRELGKQENAHFVKGKHVIKLAECLLIICNGKANRGISDSHSQMKLHFVGFDDCNYHVWYFWNRINDLQ